MFALSLMLLASSAWTANAQDDDAYHPHGAFAFIRSGERTPLLTGDSQVLTALGAQQMYQLGQNLRARWIDGGENAGLGVQNIANMSVDMLNNDQISVQTLDKQYLVSSAQAFMQGMYPPNAAGNSTGFGDATGLLADGRVVQAPLNGYQYATVQSFSEFAYNSIYIDGNSNCPEARLESSQYIVSDSFKNTKAASKETYSLLQTSWFQGNLLDDQRDYDHALEIWDYLEYQYTHNRTIYERLTGSPVYSGVYNATRHLADEYAWNFWGNTGASSSDSDNQATGGKTLAAEILHQFQTLITDRKNHSTSTVGASHPITLLFGEPDPMINLISLMRMDARDKTFQAIPPYASAIIFELFSTGADSFPASEDDLWVRFYYHNGTTDFNGRLLAFSMFNGQLLAFPMFNNGPSHTDMTWRTFNMLFGRIAMNTITEWCSSCNAPSLFCTGVDSQVIVAVNPTSSSSGKRRGLSPAVAGVVGAAVTLAAACLLLALAVLVGGVRVHRVQRRSPSALGGFKGSDKLASDADVAHLAKGGALPAGIAGFGATNTAAPRARHERVGSWELRQKELGRVKSGDVGDEFPSPRESFEHIDVVTSRPVQPRESV
ncbi:phosphoglycerate mutase-like protein [Didymella exigua CBS 183.55]|uniref:Phosphoglycerate mutase-like protein n=1 Tax=Didymella exigua CBS 183.55 TaxID=1150837 RepID=A0A6A5RTN8_9PLEO|nr:phosphoglycerate mutase-like protein [Didymella exigua CBS 183.55]KAF1930909.1 phosphoglycerate mutase-like protein [Didymella exigua CBS 183.55]